MNISNPSSNLDMLLEKYLGRETILRDEEVLNKLKNPKFIDTLTKLEKIGNDELLKLYIKSGYIAAKVGRLEEYVLTFRALGLGENVTIPSIGAYNYLHAGWSLDTAKTFAKITPKLIKYGLFDKAINDILYLLDRAGSNYVLLFLESSHKPIEYKKYIEYSNFIIKLIEREAKKELFGLGNRKSIDFIGIAAKFMIATPYALESKKFDTFYSTIKWLFDNNSPLLDKYIEGSYTFLSKNQLSKFDMYTEIIKKCANYLISSGEDYNREMHNILSYLTQDEDSLKYVYNRKLSKDVINTVLLKKFLDEKFAINVGINKLEELLKDLRKNI